MTIEPLPLAIVVLTHNRKDEVLRTLRNVMKTSRAFPICVVDNGSRDGTALAIASEFPSVRVIPLPENVGAAARNEGVRAMNARYIAFCDDDTWWAPGSLARAIELFEAHPTLAAITARVLVGRENRQDPTSDVMARSPIPNALGIPGAEVAGIMAGAAAMRRSAFLAVGGYEPRFFIGGEERLLALDLMAAGWHLAYCADMVVHHHPSRLRDAAGRRHLLLRNALWCAWLRRSLRGAFRETRGLVGELIANPNLLRGFAEAILGLPWVLRNRRPVPLAVEARLSLLDRANR